MAMESSTGWGDVFGAATGAATSYFNAETAAQTNRANQRNQLALAGQQTAAQKTILIVGLLAVVLVVVAVIFRKR